MKRIVASLVNMSMCIFSRGYARRSAGDHGYTIPFPQQLTCGDNLSCLYHEMMSLRGREGGIYTIRRKHVTWAGLLLAYSAFPSLMSRCPLMDESTLPPGNRNRLEFFFTMQGLFFAFSGANVCQVGNPPRCCREVSMVAT